MSRYTPKPMQMEANPLSRASLQSLASTSESEDRNKAVAMADLLGENPERDSDEDILPPSPPPEEEDSASGGASASRGPSARSSRRSAPPPLSAIRESRDAKAPAGGDAKTLAGSINAKPLNWEFEKLKNLWAAFPPSANTALTEAKYAGRDSVEITMRKNKFRVEFSKMALISVSSGKEKSVRFTVHRDESETKCVSLKISAHGMQNPDTLQPCCLYLVVRQRSRVFHQTQVLPKASEAVWFPFNILLANLNPKEQITFAVYDYLPVDDDPLLGQTSIGVQQLSLLSKNGTRPLEDEAGRDAGVLKFHLVKIGHRKPSGSIQALKENAAPFVLGVVDRTKNKAGKIEYRLRATPTAENPDVDTPWDTSAKFGRIVELNDTLTRLKVLEAYKDAIAPFPPRPKNLFGHSRKFLDDRQLKLQVYLYSLMSLCVPPSSGETPEARSLRETLYEFLGVTAKVKDERARRDLEERARAARERAKKREAERKRDLEENDVGYVKEQYEAKIKALMAQLSNSKERFDRAQREHADEKMDLERQLSEAKGEKAPPPPAALSRRPQPPLLPGARAGTSQPPPPPRTGGAARNGQRFGPYVRNTTVATLRRRDPRVRNIQDWYLVKKQYQTHGRIVVGLEVRGIDGTDMEGAEGEVTSISADGKTCVLLQVNRGVEERTPDVACADLEPVPDDDKESNALIVYYSTAPGNTEVRKRTMWMTYLLDQLQVYYITKDVSVNRKDREFMIRQSRAPWRRSLPQLFKGDQYLITWPEMRELNNQNMLVTYLWRQAKHVFMRSLT